MTDKVVDAVRVRPIALDRDDVEALILDQRLRDPRANAVELGRAVRRFANQNDARFADPADEAREIGVAAVLEGLAMLRDEPRDRDADGRARLHDTRRLGLPLVILAFPTLLADQRHEAHVGEILTVVFVLVRRVMRISSCARGSLPTGTTRCPPILS